MPFVATKFPLPTVSRADGTLGAYVQFPVNPGGPQFIWPAQRIANLLAKQKAAKKVGLQGVRIPRIPLNFRSTRRLGDNIFTTAWDYWTGNSYDSPFSATSAAPPPPVPPDYHTDSNGCITDDDGNLLTCPGPGGKQMPSKAAQVANAAAAALLKAQAASAANSKQTADGTPVAPMVQGVPNTALYIGGGLIAAGLLVALVKGGRR